jgi:6-phosphogluconolactonase
MFGTLADEIVTRLRSGITQNGKASFVGSGGSTPRRLYEDLSGKALDWDKVWVTLSDERWIDPGQDGSNEQLLRATLLRDKAAAAHLVPMKTLDASPVAAQQKVDQAIAAMPRPFDIMLLGMGDDGHTASLFPNMPGLEDAMDLHSPALVRAVHAEGAEQTSERLTLTLRAILDARWIVLLIKGEKKMQAYSHAISSSAHNSTPIRRVLESATAPTEVFWSP